MGCYGYLGLWGVAIGNMELTDKFVSSTLVPRATSTHGEAICSSPSKMLGGRRPGIFPKIWADRPRHAPFLCTYILKALGLGALDGCPLASGRRGLRPSALGLSPTTRSSVRAVLPDLAVGLRALDGCPSASGWHGSCAIGGHRRMGGAASGSSASGLGAPSASTVGWVVPPPALLSAPLRVVTAPGLHAIGWQRRIGAATSGFDGLGRTGSSRPRRGALDGCSRPPAELLTA